MIYFCYLTTLFQLHRLYKFDEFGWLIIKMIVIWKELARGLFQAIILDFWNTEENRGKPQ